MNRLPPKDGICYECGLPCFLDEHFCDDSCRSTYMKRNTKNNIALMRQTKLRKRLGIPSYKRNRV